MFNRLNNFKIRKAIARAMTEQCDIDESNVVTKNVHIISSEPTMEGFDIEFTINGEDGEQFKTSIKNDGPFSDVYVGKIELVVPKYDHEVYFITKELLGDALYASSRAIKDTTMTRIEWLKSLHDDAVLDKAERTVIPLTSFGFGYPKMIEGQWEFSNLGHPIFDTYKEASKYATNANFGNVMKAAMGKIAEASKPTPALIEVWGIKPLSKTPVMLGAVDAASFDQACFILMEESKIGITMERDSRTRAYFFYNGRPVFTSKEAAQHCIDIEYARKHKVNEALKKAGEAMKNISFYHCHIPTLDLQALGSTITIEVPKKRLQKVSDIKCFNQLASVIGKGQAQVELFKVMHNESCWVDIDVDDFALALDWALTPQGYDYWDSLYAHIRKAKVISKLKPSDLPYYKDLVGLLGERQAKRQLNKVLNTPECHDNILAQTIGDAFTWHLTPQGEELWSYAEYELWAK